MFRARLILTLLSALSVGITFSTSALAVSRFVATTGSDVGDCSDSAAPCKTIQFAISQSAAGDDIQISAGQYNENNLLIGAGMELSFFGAGPGMDPANATIVDGGGLDVVFFNNSDNVAFSNLTVQNGNGGIFNNGISVSIDNALIRANNAGNSALFNNGEGLLISNTDILDNLTSSSGGGIFNNGGNAVLTGVRILGNHSMGSGGGIFNNGNDLILDQVAIDDNEADSFGGGMFNNGNGLAATSLSISGNKALGSGLSGGGIFNNGNSLSCTDCAFNHNSSDLHGGFMFNNGSDLIFNRCSISRNQTVDSGGIGADGGAIFDNGSFQSFLNCTLSNNSATGNGGAIFYNSGLDLTLVNVTIADNSDTMAAGGIVNNGSATVFLKNGIMANASGGGNCGGMGSFSSLGHNLSDDGTCPLGGTGDLPAGTNPMLDPLQDNGGNTLTRALLFGSPAIDGVPTPDCTDSMANPINVDQRNFPRPAGPDCDIGSFEFSPGIFQFDMTNYIVNEDAGTATITVTRSGGFDGNAMVDFATSDGTAVAGVNYLATSGTLNFAQNETSMTFDVTILEDNQSGPDLTANLTLSNPTEGASLGTPNPAILTIISNPGGNVVISGGTCGLFPRPETALLPGWILAFLPGLGFALLRMRGNRRPQSGKSTGETRL